ncbi:MAG: hypothetical protein OHK0039_23400 [Bacteroidia bacterium]
MRSASTKSFTTRNGTCHLYTDRIEIHREDLLGRVERWLYSRGMRRAWVLYALLAAALAIACLAAWLIDNYFLTLFFLTLVPVTLYAAWHHRYTSFAPVVLRSEIESVVYHKAVPGVSRAMFVVSYRPRQRLVQRIISLPTLSQQGASVADTAYWMMRDEGLLS